MYDGLYTIQYILHITMYVKRKTDRESAREPER